MKRFLGILCLIPYVLIGFIEMFHTSYKASDAFKTNMMYVGLLGLISFFNREIITLYNLIRNNKTDGTKENGIK